MNTEQEKNQSQEPLLVKVVKSNYFTLVLVILAGFAGFLIGQNLYSPAPADNIGNEISRWQFAVATEPTAENYLNLGLAYYYAGDYQKSIEATQEALQINPDYAQAYNNLGAAYNNLKEWDKAIQALEKAIELDPSLELAKNNLEVAKLGKQQNENSGVN